jgi:hypothetical protein
MPARATLPPATIQAFAGCGVDRFRHAELVFNQFRVSGMVRYLTELVNQHGAAGDGHECALLRAEVVDRKCALALLDDSEVVDMPGAAAGIGERIWVHSIQRRWCGGAINGYACGAIRIRAGLTIPDYAD